MPATALIHIGGSPGPSLNVTAGATVSLSNADNTGVSTWAWVLLDKPPGSAAALTSGTASTTSFVADVEGTFLIELTVNAGLADAISARTVAAVKQLATRARVPAFGEQREADVAGDGWAVSVNELLRLVDQVYENPGCIAAVNTTGGDLDRGDVVFLYDAATVLTGLPGERQLPGVAAASAAVPDNCLRPLYIVEGTVAGVTPAPNNSVMRLRHTGTIRLTGSMSAGDRVYLQDAGGFANGPGTVAREVGLALDYDGAANLIAFDGSMAPMLLAASTVRGHSAVELPVTGAGAARVSRTTGTGVLRVGTEVNAALELMANSTVAWAIDPTSGALVAQGGGNRKVSNVTDPAAAQDAATKAYVDAIPPPWWDERLPAVNKTTTDATPTVLTSYSTQIPENYGGGVLVMVQATRRDRGASVAWVLLASITNVGGVHAQYGSTILLGPTTAGPGWTATITDGGGSSINVEIVGQAATTVDWRCAGCVVRSTG